MSRCGRCNSNNCCCTTACSTTPYYTQVDVCEEDNCEKIYVNQFSFGICPDVSWNVPSCGQASLLSVPGVVGVSLGSYIWNASYGYFQIISVDPVKGLVGVANLCTVGNVDAGTQVPKCTCFVITDFPHEATQDSDVFPFVAIDFTAPAIGDCTDITVTTLNGLSPGDVISIGSGLYTIDEILGNNVIKICNTGEGILAGTSVIAKDQFGNYNYPIYTISNCCEALTTNIVDSSLIWGGLSTGSANAQEIDLDMPIASLTDGQMFNWAAGFSSTATDPTLEIPAGAPTTMRDSLGVRLFPGDLEVGRAYQTLNYASNVRVMNLPGSRVVYRDVTSHVVVNSAALTTISTILIPAGVLYAGRQLRLKVGAILHNASGGSEDGSITVTYGGTDIGGGITGSVATGTDSWIVVDTMLTAATIASQVAYSVSNALVILSPSVTAVLRTTSAINAAANQNLLIKAQLSAADPDLSITIDTQILEYL